MMNMKVTTVLIFSIFALFFQVVEGDVSRPGESPHESTRLTGKSEDGLRVVRKMDNTGFLQMKVGDKWKTVWADSLSQNEVDLACFELGFSRSGKNTMEVVFANPDLWLQTEFVEIRDCPRGVVSLNACFYDVLRWGGNAAIITCGDPLPKLDTSKNPEKLVGKFYTDHQSQAFIEIWDGTALHLVGPTRRDVKSLVKAVSSPSYLGYFLFEGYRRGTAFQVISCEPLRFGNPLYESVSRPPTLEGEHTALVVRVTVNGLVPNATQDQIRSELFNADGEDKWNINLFEKCSYGSYKIAPYTGGYAGLTVYNGVMDFQVKLSEEDMKNKFKKYEWTSYYWLGHVISTKFPYDDSVDFILFVVPDGLVDWGTTAAFAGRPGRFSVYKDLQILNPFVVGHEIGHNLGLRHSADVADPWHEYGDHTCLMGNGYVGDSALDFDESTHCFNNAKNSQLGWFTDRTAHWSISDGLKTFDLVGLGDYAIQNDKQIISVEIESNGVQCYLGFNRISGINKDVMEYPDLVTMQCVYEDISYLVAHLGSGDLSPDLNVSIKRREQKDIIKFNLDFTIYVETIEIKSEGQASFARIILGSETEVLNDNEVNRRPTNCIVDAIKSANHSCTEQCGFVPAVPKDGYPALHGGSCDDYECRIYDGLCVVGGKCTAEVLQPLFAKLSSHSHKPTGPLCNMVLPFPQHWLSNITCHSTTSLGCNHSFCDKLLMSNYHRFCTYDFSSKTNVDEVEKKLTFTLTYSVGGRSTKDTSPQFSGETFSRNLADLLGEDSVVVNIDKVSNTVEVTVDTKHHADLEDRLKHKWLLDRLREKLEYDEVYVDFDKLEVKVDEDEDQNFLDKVLANKLILIGAIAGMLGLSTSIFCICYNCGSSQTKKPYVIDV
jgi:hypothetical protein